MSKRHVVKPLEQIISGNVEPRTQGVAHSVAPNFQTTVVWGRGKSEIGRGSVCRGTPTGWEFLSHWHLSRFAMHLLPSACIELRQTPFRPVRKGSEEPW